MSTTIDEGVKALNAKLDGGLDGGTAQFDVTGEGSILVDDAGAREGTGEADVTLTADAETFRGMLEGDTNPTTAFMSGKLTVDGDMGLAMKLAGLLA